MSQARSAEEPVGLLIAACRRRLKQAAGRRAADYGVSAQQFWALVAIAEMDGPALNELAAKLRIDEPTASRVVGALRRRRFVVVEVDRQDRRRNRLKLTRSGHTLAGKLAREADEIRAATVAGLSRARQEELRGLLRKVIGNMDQLGETEDGHGRQRA